MNKANLKKTVFNLRRKIRHLSKLYLHTEVTKKEIAELKKLYAEVEKLTGKKAAKSVYDLVS